MASTLDQDSAQCHVKFCWETRFDVLHCTTDPQDLHKKEAHHHGNRLSVASGFHRATKSL
jgi:hypothetical protein